MLANNHPCQEGTEEDEKKDVWRARAEIAITWAKIYIVGGDNLIRPRNTYSPTTMQMCTGWDSP